MVSTTPPQAPTTLKGEQRVVIHHVTWAGYLQILSALPETRSARLIYDNGTLEMTMPGEDHEWFGRMIGRFIWILVEELSESLGLNIKTMGSTTMNFPGLKKGAEPDEAFYLQNQAAVVGRKVDFATDPPPDLVLEVDITNTDIDKNRLYAAMGIPEFWRFDGQTLRIFQLQAQTYQEVATSPTFPDLPSDRLYQFLADCKTNEIQASKALRTWIQEEILQLES